MLSYGNYVMKTLMDWTKIEPTLSPVDKGGRATNRLSHDTAYQHYESWNTLLDAV
jgi:hypothetical protein